jgi:hypothetical protein
MRECLAERFGWGVFLFSPNKTNRWRWEAVFLVVKVSGFLYYNGSLLSLEGNSLPEPGNRFDGRLI